MSETHDPMAQFETGDTDEFQIDLTDVASEKDKYRFPPGEYDAVLSDVERHKSAAGNPSIKFTFTVTDGTREMTIRLYASKAKKAAWRMAQVTEALGVGGPGQLIKFTPKDVIGKSVRLVLKDGDTSPQYPDVKSDIATVKAPTKEQLEKSDLPF